MEKENERALNPRLTGLVLDSVVVADVLAFLGAAGSWVGVMVRSLLFAFACGKVSLLLLT